MTENEVFEHIGDLAGDYKCFDEKISHQESLILCNLIEEVQQYRAIGTIEEFKALKVENEELHCEIQAINATMDLLENEIRAKAIDGFVSALIPRLTDAIYPQDVASMTNLINDVAEELKAGAE